MLQLKTKNADICRIGKLLAGFDIKVSITQDVITLEGNITDALLESLCDSVKINAISNYKSGKNECVSEVTEVTEVTEHKETHTESVEEVKHVDNISKVHEEYDLKYFNVKRGDVYMCDLDPVVGREQGGERPCVIVQNDSVNKHSNTTIVIACTTTSLKFPVTQLSCFFSSTTMNKLTDLFYNKNNTLMAEQIRAVDKRRLRAYVGTLKPEIVNELEEKICVSLGLNQNVNVEEKEKIVYVEKPVEKVVYIDKPVLPATVADSNVQNERKDVNTNQVQILSLVDVSEFLNISQQSAPYKVRVEKILKLFGFDLEKNGVQYLVEAITFSPKSKYFNLETLTEFICKDKEVDAEEVKRLIVARVKETLHFKKAPTIDFIRLINAFIKQEDEDETDV